MIGASVSSPSRAGMIVVSAVPSGPPAPSGMVPGIVPRAVPRSPRAVPGIVPRIPSEAPAPAADREAGPPRTVPAPVPRIAVDHRSPRSEHRRNVLGFDPHLVARDHDVVERRIIGRSVAERAAVTRVEVARRHLVARRLEAAQTARIGAFVVVGQHALIGIRIRSLIFVIVVLGSRGLRLGDLRLPFGPAGFGGSTLRLGLGLLPAGDLRLVMHGVEVVGGISRRSVICRRAAGQTGGEQDGSDQNSQLFHSAQGYCLR